MLPAVVFYLLRKFHRTGKRKRISAIADWRPRPPALAAGLDYEEGSGFQQIEG